MLVEKPGLNPLTLDATKPEIVRDEPLRAFMEPRGDVNGIGSTQTEAGAQFGGPFCYLGVYVT
jgi:hypothetical protein